jgi:SOS-response transcriptional repressor LexA
MNGLPPRQLEVYRFVKTYIRQKDRCPAFRDVSAGIGLSLTTVVEHLHALKDKGYITWDKHTSRSLRVLK